jgi:hypothetical protein
VNFKSIQLGVLAGTLSLSALPAWAGTLETDGREVQALETKAGMAHPAAIQDKETLVAALDQLSNQVQSDGGEEAGWKPEDYDALYALLQKYREELKAAKVRMAKLEAEGASLTAQEQDLEKRLNQLPPDGFKINGEVRLTGDGIWMHRPELMSNGSATPTEFFYGLPGLTLFFVGNKGMMSAKARYDINTFMGDLGHQEGLRLITAEMRTPVGAVQLGNFDARFTPLTLWRHEDPEPFEPEPFVSRRQRLRDDELLDAENSWNLKAIRFLTDATFVGKQEVDFEGWWTVQAQGQQPIYQASANGLETSVPTLLTPTGQVSSGTLTSLNDIYLAAWKARLPFAGGWSLQYIGNKYWEKSGGSVYYDSSSTAIWPQWIRGQAVWGFDSQVNSFLLDWDPWKGQWAFDVEVARSTYSNPNDSLQATKPFSTDYQEGYAGLAGTKWDNPLWSGRVGVNFVQAGFYSPMAQGRTVDPSQFLISPLLSENTTFNAGTSGHGGFPFNSYSESYFNNTIIPPLLGVNGTIVDVLYSGPAFLPYQLDQAASPYGEASPNRMGAHGELEFKLMGGALRPKVLAEWQQEIDSDWDITYAFSQPVPTSSPKYTVFSYGGGAHWDLGAGGMPVKLVAGLIGSSGSDLPVVSSAFRQAEFNTVSLDAGLECQPWKTGDVSFGLMRKEYYTTVYVPLVSPTGSFSEWIYQELSLGLGQRINDWTRFDLTASVLYYPSNLDFARQNELRQIWSKFSILF